MTSGETADTMEPALSTLARRVERLMIGRPELRVLARPVQGEVVRSSVRVVVSFVGAANADVKSDGRSKNIDEIFILFVIDGAGSWCW